MTDEKPSTTTASLGAISAVASIFSAIGKAAIVFFMALLEYARIKQKKAEDELANEKVNVSIKEKQDAIEKKTEFKSSVDVIDGFLAEHNQSSSDGGKPKP